MELNVDEALRYLGIGGQAAESIRASVAAVADKLTAAIQPRYTYRVCSLQKTEAGFLLPEAELVLPGADAAKMLEQCDQAVLMACTLGTQFEALLRGEQARDMSRAVILAACGSAWVEAGCDQVEQELAHCLPNRYRTDRFSPGYGDLPLSLQPKICARTGYPKAAWTVCNRELFDEPIQVSHRHHRLVRLAPDGPHPWMHILFDA